MEQSQMKNLEAFSCTISPRAGGRSVNKTASIPFIVHTFIVHKARDILTWNGNSYYQALPPLLCLPIIPHDQISQAFPLCICLLQVIKYWRWEQPGKEANAIIQTHHIAMTITLIHVHSWDICRWGNRPPKVHSGVIYTQEEKCAVV